MNEAKNEFIKNVLDLIKLQTDSDDCYISTVKSKGRYRHNTARPNVTRHNYAFRGAYGWYIEDYPNGFITSDALAKRLKSQFTQGFEITITKVSREVYQNKE